jgi:hypothetical protein
VVFQIKRWLPDHRHLLTGYGVAKELAQIAGTLLAGAAAGRPMVDAAVNQLGWRRRWFTTHQLRNRIRQNRLVFGIPGLRFDRGAVAELLFLEAFERPCPVTAVRSAWEPCLLRLQRLA